MRGRFAEAGAVAGLAACFVTIKLCEYLSFNVDDYDTGIYSNLAWNIANGEGFYSDVLRSNHLGEHFSPIIAAFAPLYRLVPSAAWLLVAQALAVAATFPLLRRVFERIAAPLRGHSARWLAPGCLLLFLLYRPMWTALYHDFHPSTLGMPLVAAALLFLHRGSDRALWWTVACLFTTKELAVASTAGLSIYALAVLGRGRLAAGLAAAAVAGGLLVFGAVMPAFRDGGWGHLARVGPLDQPFAKLVYLGRLVLPLGLLPLFGWRALLAALPTTLVNLAVAHPPQFSLRYHYDDQNCVFWIVAAAHGARWIAARLEALPPGPRIAWGRGSAVAVLVLALALTGPSPIGRLLQWWPTPEDRALRAAVAEQAALPADVAITAQSCLGPRLAHRHHYRSLRTGDLESLAFAPGERIVLAPGLGSFELDVAAARARLAAEPRARLAARGGGLEVYVWSAPGAEP